MLQGLGDIQNTRIPSGEVISVQMLQAVAARVSQLPPREQQRRVGRAYNGEQLAAHLVGDKPVVPHGPLSEGGRVECCLAVARGAEHGG